MPPAATSVLQDDGNVCLTLSPAKFDTILAALRHYAAHFDSVTEPILEIATNSGLHEALNSEQIDALAEEINNGY